MRSQKSCNKLKTSFLELLSQSDGLSIRMTELLKLEWQEWKMVR